MFINRSQSNSDPGSHHAANMSTSQAKSPRRFWHFPVTSNVDTALPESPSIHVANNKSFPSISPRSRKHNKSSSAGTIDLRPKNHFHFGNFNNNNNNGTNPLGGATVVRRPSEAVRGMRRNLITLEGLAKIPASPTHSSSRDENNNGKRREYQLSATMNPSSSTDGSGSSLNQGESISPPVLPQIYTQPMAIPVSLELTEPTPTRTDPPKLPVLHPFASSLQSSPQGLFPHSPDSVSSLTRTQAEPQRSSPPPSSLRLSGFSSATTSDTETLYEPRTKGHTPPLRIRPRPSAPALLSLSQASHTGTGSKSPEEGSETEKEVDRSNDDRRATIRPAPKVPLPPIPFEAILVDIVSRPAHSTPSEARLTSGIVGGGGSGGERVVVILDFAYSTGDPPKNESVRLPLDLIKRGGGGGGAGGARNHLVDFIEKALKQFRAKARSVEVDAEPVGGGGATSEAALAEAMQDDKALRTNDTNRRLYNEGLEQTTRPEASVSLDQGLSRSKSSASKPDMTDGESDSESDLESEYGLESLLR